MNSSKWFLCLSPIPEKDGRYSLVTSMMVNLEVIGRGCPPIGEREPRGDASEQGKWFGNIWLMMSLGKGMTGWVRKEGTFQGPSAPAGDLQFISFGAENNVVRDSLDKMF